MTPLGVALIDPATGAILQEWDRMPGVITHAGEDRTGAIVGAEFSGGCLLVARVLENPPPHQLAPVTSQSSRLEGDRVVVTRSYGAPDLAPIKASAKIRIGAAAEAARGKYITLGAGKSMSYQEVAKEAARYQATNGAGSYPFLQARINSGRYASLAAAAAGTIAIEAQWAVVGATIDEIEDRAKLAIDAATTVDAVDAVEAAAQAEWP